MKKKLLRLALVLALLVLLIVAAFQYFKRGIQVERVTADLHFTNQDQLDIDMRIFLDNRFFWETKIYGVKYQLKMAEQTILEGMQDYDTLVIDQHRNEIPLELKLSPKKIRSIIDSLQITDSTFLQLDYQVDFQLPIIGRQQTRKTTLKKIEVPIPPQITLESLKVDKLKLSEPIEVLATVKLVNRGNVALSISDLSYKFLVENESWASGIVTDPIEVESASEQLIELPLKIAPGEVGKRLWQRFVNRDSIHYSIEATGKLNLQVKQLEVQDIDFELDGVY